MTGNKKIAIQILNMFAENGFPTYNVEYMDGYFIFDIGEDSVIHFRVKGVWSGWKFGMWINSEDKEKTVELFVQHDDNIDKFKPTRSSIVEEFSLEDFKDDIVGFRIGWMLRSLKYHPILCYFDNYSNGMYKSYIFEFLENKYTIAKNFLLDKLQYIYIIIARIKIFFIKKNKNIEKIELKKQDFFGGYHYDLNICFKEDNIDKMLDCINFFFKKNRYGFKNCFDAAFEISFYNVDEENRQVYFDWSK